MAETAIAQGFRKTGTPYISTTNACKLCKPLGACLVFRGIEGAIPFLHGSQGCATYMRRYIISHYREPVDIASSALGEKHAVYGGGPNLKQGLVNVTNTYQPSLIGVATTCLTETIGDDVPFIVGEYRREVEAENPDVVLPALVTVSTPSYAGTHMEGFHVAVKGVVEQLAVAAETSHKVNLLPGLISPADTRYLKEMLADFGLRGTILPDISESLDGPSWEEYQKIPAGGTPLGEIRNMGGAKATLEFGRTLGGTKTAGADLE
ncbi:MAG TPA: nitrogenase component 1, partial [Deferrisomatales bacterium]|nr:nitrogenase component 1 [Deferrisomatales bacterium]